MKDPWAVRCLKLLAAAVCRRPRWFIHPHWLLFAASLWFTVTHLEFDMNRNNLVGADKKYHRNYLRFKAEFQAQDDLVAVVESEDVEKNRQFVERLGRRLEAETNLFTDVFYKGDLQLMGRKGLLFITNDTILVEMRQRLEEARPMLRSFVQVTNLNSLFRMVNRQFRAAGGERNENVDSLIKALPALTRIADQATDAIDRSGTPPSPGVTAMFDGGEEAEQNLYITFASNRIYLVTARATQESLNQAAVSRLRELVRLTQAEVPGLSVDLTGEPVLEIDEMAQVKRDTTVATVLSLVVCAILFIVGYKETGRPLKATLCLVIGLGYTLGFTTLVYGYLNLLTVTFLPILVGLAIDFGIHLVARFEEELRRGTPERDAMERAMVNTGLGIFTGCFTTAGAFLAMGLTDFKGIQEMGVISGIGLVICLVPMLTLLPALLLKGRQNTLDHTASPAVPDRRAQLERVWIDHPGWVLGIALTLTTLACTQFHRVRFDYNLLNLQSHGLPAVDTELKLINGASRSVIFGIVMVDSLERAVELERQLLALDSVANIDSMASYLSASQGRRLELIREIKSLLEDLRFAEIDPDPVDLSELRQTLLASYTYFGLGARGANSEGETELSAELQEVRRAIGRFRRQLSGADEEAVARKLGEYQRALLKDLQSTLQAIRNQDDSAPLTIADLPDPLLHRFVGRSGTNYLLQINPRDNVWERQAQETFVTETRRIAPDVTGTPIQLYEYTTLLRDSYIEAAYYALGAIAILVFIHFRSLLCVVLSLLPVVLGTVWTLGYMGWQGLPFNPANIMTLPLIVGVGVTNGIHILNRFGEEQNPGILARSTGKAVLLSALTTVAGFGSLVPAKHQGISCLGLLMAIGTAACMIAGLTFLPTMLAWMQRRGWRVGEHLARFLKRPPREPSPVNPLP